MRRFGPTAVGEGPDRLLDAHAELVHAPLKCLGIRDRQSPAQTGGIWLSGEGRSTAKSSSDPPSLIGRKSYLVSNVRVDRCRTERGNGILRATRQARFLIRNTDYSASL